MNRSEKLKIVLFFIWVIMPLQLQTTASAVDLSVTGRLVKYEGKVNYYEVRSNSFRASDFAKSDFDDYTFRVSRRNCLDNDMIPAYKLGAISVYDFYGVDSVHVGRFIVSEETCKKDFWRK